MAQREKKNRRNTETALVIGSGGREHALAWKLAQSSKVRKVFVAPGNGGTSVDKSGKIENLIVDVNNPEAVIEVCQLKDIALVVVGPEAPLAAGLADVLRKKGFPTFGPNQNAAIIEGSKVFSKDFMKRHKIPTAAYQSFTDVAKAIEYVNVINYPIVIKASGLAAGKGVILPESKEEAIETIKNIMVKKIFGEAGAEVVIEERLTGEEASVLAITDGYTVIPMPPAQDHKRIRDGDQGPNTGGMGAYAPAPVVTEEIQEFILTKILQPTVDGLRKEGRPFVGCLYAGVMLTPNKGVQVLEFNCRFGDPETEVLLPLLSSETDLFDVFLAAATGCLDSVPVSFSNLHAATVVLASEGYPDSYPKGLDVTGTESITDESTIVFHAGTEHKDGKIKTSGGRVLTVTGIGADLDDALSKAYAGVHQIEFKGAQYRTDIGQKAKELKLKPKSLYSLAGVNIDEGNRAVQLMKSAVQATYGPEVLAGVGAFGGLYSGGILKEMKHPVLVGSSDGVGTKIMVAAHMEKYDTIGQCLVNHCINDILVQGGKPLFFLDYVAANKLKPEMVAAFVSGCAKACKNVGCALLGGETAEMPGVYRENEFDVAGFIVGAVDKENIVDGAKTIEIGDVILALESTGLHTNGYSLARRIVKDHDLKKELKELGGKSLGDALLAVHRHYIPEYDALIKAGVRIKGLAHITGGGLIDNPPRILPPHVACNFIKGSWTLPPLFQFLQREGNVTDDEMARVFNIGLGMLIFVDPSQKEKAIGALKGLAPVHVVGNTVPRSEHKGKEIVFSGNKTFGRPLKLAILGSTKGTDMLYIIEQIKEKKLHATIEIVVSDVADALILKRASEAGIRTKLISSYKVKTPKELALNPKKERIPKEVYDPILNDTLQKYQIDLILCIGWMRIISAPFVRQWENRIFNVHPSLLPLFAGGMNLQVHEQVIKAGAKETGCTVHYIDEGVDTGKIIIQKSCPVLPEDTPITLKDKVQALEGLALVEAIKLFANGKV